MADMEAAIRTRLSAILQDCDWDNVTERSIRTQLSQELGPMDEYKEFITGMINQSLEEKAAREEEEAAAAAAAGSSKRKPAGPASGQPPSKAGREDKFVVELEQLKRATVQSFKGKVQVDLREFYEDKETGELKPGQKGIALAFEQWLVLKANLRALVDAAKRGQSGGPPVVLSSDRHAYVSEFRGKCSVHVREMYEKDGEMLPGKKGVMLSTAAVEHLLASSDDITAEAEQRGAPAGSVPARPAAAAAAPAARPSVLREVQSTTSRAPSGGAAGEEGEGGMVELGGDRRACVKNFKGKNYVDLREYYTKDGEKLPGKKGIMLPVPEFKLVAQHAAAITRALEGHNTAYELDLGSKRKVTVSEFRGKVYAGIREFYDAGGELKPGAKGLNMSLEQWQKLVAGLPRLEAAL